MNKSVKQAIHDMEGYEFNEGTDRTEGYIYLVSVKSFDTMTGERSDATWEVVPRKGSYHIPKMLVTSQMKRWTPQPDGFGGVCIREEETKCGLMTKCVIHTITKVERTDRLAFFIESDDKLVSWEEVSR